MTSLSCDRDYDYEWSWLCFFFLFKSWIQATKPEKCFNWHCRIWSLKWLNEDKWSSDGQHDKVSTLESETWEGRSTGFRAIISVCLRALMPTLLFCLGNRGNSSRRPAESFDEPSWCKVCVLTFCQPWQIFTARTLQKLCHNKGRL